MATAPTLKIDRQTTTPFHLKLFYKTGGFHSLSDFPTIPTTGALPPHLQIYTWPSCTLRELSHLLLTALPSLIPTSPSSPSNPNSSTNGNTTAIGTRLSYRLIYPDTRTPHTSTSSTQQPRYISKDLGSVVVGGDGAGGGIWPSESEIGVIGGGEGIMKGKLGGDPSKTLAEGRFVVGDFVDCAVFLVGEDGSINSGAAMGSSAYPSSGRGGYGREGPYGRDGGGGYGRENGYGSGYRGRGGGGGRGRGMGMGMGIESGRLGGEGVPSGEWRRGERIPDGPGRGGYGRGRGRGY